MAYKNAHGVSGTLTQPLPASLTATIMQLDATSGVLMRALLAAGDWTYLLLDAGVLSEVVKVFYSSTNNFTIVRAQDGSKLNAHVPGAPAAFVLTSAAVSSQVSPVPMTVTGDGLVVATTSGLDVNIHVDEPEFTSSGITISGSWPNLDFAVTEDDTSCCGGSSGGGSSGITSLFGFGIANVVQSGTTATITTEAPNFTSTDGTVAINGTWPNIDFSAASDGVGTVTSVSAGNGISVTGSPTTAPVVGLAASGVTAGAYGGLQVDVYGRLTAIDSAFNPPSIIASGSAAITSARVGNTQTLTATLGAEGTIGVLALADASDPLDPTDHTTAVNPALLASVIDSLAGTSVAGASTYTPVATALYTNILSGALLTVDIPAGESILVHAHVTMVNTTTPATPVEFGIAVFNTAGAGTILQGDQLITQSQQSMSFILAGPLTTSLALLTTAVPSGAAVVSQGLMALTP